MIWKLQQVSGSGWLREFAQGRPIVTGREDEAFEFPAATEALFALRQMPREVRWRVVEREPRPGGPARFDPTHPTV